MFFKRKEKAKLQKVNPKSLKQYEESFKEALKNRTHDIVSDKHCIVIDETLPDEIVKAADERLRREGRLSKENK